MGQSLAQVFPPIPYSGVACMQVTQHRHIRDGHHHTPCQRQSHPFDPPSISHERVACAAIQYNLPGTWDGMKSRGLGPELLAQWWSSAPAKLAGLTHRKGSIAVGLDADLVASTSPYIQKSHVTTKQMEDKIKVCKNWHQQACKGKGKGRLDW